MLVGRLVGWSPTLRGEQKNEVGWLVRWLVGRSVGRLVGWLVGWLFIAGCPWCICLPGTEVGLRFNPGLGSGGTSKTNVGGPSSSFGIWHEHAEECLEIANTYESNYQRAHRTCS